MASNAQLYSTYTRETAEEDHAAHANNTFQHCPNSAMTAASHSTNPSSSQTAHSSSTGAAGSGHHVDTGAVIGGVVGGVLGLCRLMLGAACVMRRTRSGKAAVYDERPLATTETTSLGAHPFTLQQTGMQLTFAESAPSIRLSLHTQISPATCARRPRTRSMRRSA